MVEKRLRDIMSKKFVTVTKMCPLPEAIKLLCTGGSNSPGTLVVMDDDHETFWGLFTKECILESIYPSFMKKSTERKVVAWDGLLTESCRKLFNLTVKDIADTELPRLKPEDRLIKIIDLFLKTNRRELPVIVDDTPVGLVGVQDVIREIQNLITGC